MMESIIIGKISERSDEYTENRKPRSTCRLFIVFWFGSRNNSRNISRYNYRFDIFSRNRKGKV